MESKQNENGTKWNKNEMKNVLKWNGNGMKMDMDMEWKWNKNRIKMLLEIKRK